MKGKEIEIGKIQPQAIELEEAVLGAMLLEKSAINDVINIIGKESFYKEQNGVVFEAIIRLYRRNEPVDILTVINELKSTNQIEGVGGAYYVSSLTNRIATSSNVEYHARVIQQKYITRELIRLGTELVKKGYEPGSDCFEMIDEYNKQISQLTDFIKTSVRRVGDVCNEVIKEIKEVQENNIPTGLMSGFENIDKVTGGWQKATLTIVAARPGMGKTALALALAKNPAIKQNKPVAVFSLEMSAKQLTTRLMASESEISSSKINQKSINSSELIQVGARISKLIDCPIYIDDTPNLKFSRMRATAKKLKQDHKIELIIVDYLQLMHGDEKGNREQEISYISRNLKALSKELDLPIIALSQLSRQVENRTGVDAKRPQLSDLRESGSIEQDADNVIFLFRPAYYDMFPNGYDYGSHVLNSENLLLVDFAKGRELRVCEVPLLFYGEYMIIDNYDLRSNSLPEHQPLTSLPQNDDFLRNN